MTVQQAFIVLLYKLHSLLSSLKYIRGEWPNSIADIPIPHFYDPK